MPHIFDLEYIRSAKERVEGATPGATEMLALIDSTISILEVIPFTMPEHDRMLFKDLYSMTVGSLNQYCEDWHRDQSKCWQSFRNANLFLWQLNTVARLKRMGMSL